MKKAASLFLAGMALISCGPSALVSIKLTENAGLERKSETVEVDMTTLPDMPAEFFVTDGKKARIPFQVYHEADGRIVMVFQADVKAGSKACYKIMEGSPELFDTVAYSRHVPERRDDYAYENDLIAGRIYGPRLKKPRTMGMDVWTKSVSHPIINERFKRGNYHSDMGDGMDCYKVGNTLGAGSLAPVSASGNLVLGDNWAGCEHLTDGPVRTKARFIHGPFLVDSTEVSVVRELTLDAGSHFLLMTTEFIADTDSIDVALAAMMHDPRRIDTEDNWIAFVEPASDSKHPEQDGDIFIALVMDSGLGNAPMSTIDGHAVLCTSISTGKPARCWAGSAWSHADIKSQEQWRALVREFALRAASPLTVTIKK